MAKTTVTETISIVDPLDEITAINCANERIINSLGIVEQMIHEATFAIEKQDAQKAMLYSSWLLLQMTREYAKMTDSRMMNAERSLYQCVDVSQIHASARALGAAA